MLSTLAIHRILVNVIMIVRLYNKFVYDKPNSNFQYDFNIFSLKSNPNRTNRNTSTGRLMLPSIRTELNQTELN